MPRTKSKAPRVKPAHTIAATAGKRVRDRMQQARAAETARLHATADPSLAEQRILLRLRGEELARLHVRVEQIEAMLRKRGPQRDAYDAEIRSAVRARDSTVDALVRRVDGIEGRIAAMEFALFDVAAARLAAKLDPEPELREAAIAFEARMAAAEPGSDAAVRRNAIAALRNGTAIAEVIDALAAAAEPTELDSALDSAQPTAVPTPDGCISETAPDGTNDD